jgi:hypothetical protein
MAYRMTPARRAALRRAQAASARKRKGKGKASPSKSYKKARRRARLRVAGAVAVYAGANAAGLAIAHHQGKQRRAHAARRNRASHDQILRHTGVGTRTVHGARAHGGGPTSANRVFVTSRHGTTSVRRRHH